MGIQQLTTAITTQKKYNVDNVNRRAVTESTTSNNVQLYSRHSTFTTTNNSHASQVLQPAHHPHGYLPPLLRRFRARVQCGVQPVWGIPTFIRYPWLPNYSLLLRCIKLKTFCTVQSVRVRSYLLALTYQGDHWFLRRFLKYKLSSSILAEK